MFMAQSNYSLGVSNQAEPAGLLASATLMLLTGLVLFSATTFGWRMLAGSDDLVTSVVAGDGAPMSVAPTPQASRIPESTPPAPTTVPTSTTQEAPAEDDAAAEIAALLTRVRILADRPQIPGYERDCGPGEGCVFGTEWTDATNVPDGHNGCDTRNDVLANALTNVTFSSSSPDCDVVGGTLTDPYTGTVMDYATEGSEIHIDHMFPLAAAWDLGAASWTLERRTEFANDTAVELIAVQGTANMSKGDSTPASWLPPLKDFRCTYVTRFLTAAVAYDLAITEADQTVIGHVAAKC